MKIGGAIHKTLFTIYKFEKDLKKIQSFIVFYNLKPNRHLSRKLKFFLKIFFASVLGGGGVSSLPKFQRAISGYTLPLGHHCKTPPIIGTPFLLIWSKINLVLNLSSKQCSNTITQNRFLDQKAQKDLEA